MIAMMHKDDLPLVLKLFTNRHTCICYEKNSTPEKTQMSVKKSEIHNDYIPKNFQNEHNYERISKKHIRTHTKDFQTNKKNSKKAKYIIRNTSIQLIMKGENVFRNGLYFLVYDYKHNFYYMMNFSVSMLSRS